MHGAYGSKGGNLCCISGIDVVFASTYEAHRAKRSTKYDVEHDKIQTKLAIREQQPPGAKTRPIAHITYVSPSNFFLEKTMTDQFTFDEDDDAEFHTVDVLISAIFEAMNDENTSCGVIVLKYRDGAYSVRVGGDRGVRHDEVANLERGFSKVLSQMPSFFSGLRAQLMQRLN